MSDAPLMLSVSGMRGWVGASINDGVVARYAAAFGAWLRASGECDGQPHVVIGRDSRPSGESYERAAAAGLIAAGCRVSLLGILSTPGVAIMARHLHADGGLVITASHNPGEWNGVKPIRRETSGGGTAPPPEDVKKIIERYHADKRDYTPVASIPSDTSGGVVHRDVILPHVDANAIRRAKLKCVLDSVHGAGGPEARLLLDALGVEVVHLYAEPTGEFPHKPEPTRENLVELSNATKQHNAHIGFAQDPDADRLALVDEQGRYIGEEYTLALCALHKLKSGDTTAANLSTSRMIDDIAARAGATVHRSPVGEANVAAKMREVGAQIGGEGNGGIIFAPVSHVRDSLVGMALLLELLAQRRQPLSAIVAEIPRYAIVKDKLDADPAVIARMPAAMKRAFAGQRIDDTDGIRADFADKWVNVRASNTEPIMRIIAEAKTEQDARALIGRVRQALGIQ